MGYVTRTGVNIHKVTCASVRKGSLDRLIPANWENMPRLKTKMRIEVLVENRIGVLRTLSDVFYSMKINIDEISQNSEQNGELARLYLSISVDEDDYYLYERLVERMKLGLKEFRESVMIGNVSN